MGVGAISEVIKKEAIDKPVEIPNNIEMSKTEVSSIEPDMELIKSKSLESIVEYNRMTETIEIREKKPIENKLEGLRREDEVRKELEKKYPSEEGYKIESEIYLRDKDGNIVKDPVTGEARRIDFVVIKDGKVVDSIEVTSKTAEKAEQSAKEERIRNNGGNFIKDSNGDLLEIPEDVVTRIERRH